MLFSEVSQARFRSLGNQNTFGRFSNQPAFIFYSIKLVNKLSCFLHRPLFNASEAPPCLRTCSTCGTGQQLAVTFPGQILFCSGRELCDSTPPGLARRRPFQTVPCSLSSSRASSEVPERAGRASTCPVRALGSPASTRVASATHHPVRPPAAGKWAFSPALL